MPATAAGSGPQPTLKELGLRPHEGPRPREPLPAVVAVVLRALVGHLALPQVARHAVTDRGLVREVVHDAAEVAEESVAATAQELVRRRVAQEPLPDLYIDLVALGYA